VKLFICASLAIGVKSASTGREGQPMSENFVRDLAGKYRQKLAAKNTEDRLFLETGELLKQRAPKMWQELRELIKTNREEFNREMERDELSWDSLCTNVISMIRRKDGIKLEGEYDEATQTAHFKCEQLNIDYRFTLLVKNGSVVWVPVTPIPQVYGAEEIAEMVLKGFLES
jgi:predicted ATPase